MADYHIYIIGNITLHLHSKNIWKIRKYEFDIIYQKCAWESWKHDVLARILYFLQYPDDDKYVFGLCAFLLKIRHQVLEVNIISQQWFLDFIKYEIATFICILLKNNGFIMQQFAIQIYEKQNKIGLTYIRMIWMRNRFIYHSIDMNIYNKTVIKIYLMIWPKLNDMEISA